jgi:hypothetical protein
MKKPLEGDSIRCDRRNGEQARRLNGGNISALRIVAGLAGHLLAEETDNGDGDQEGDLGEQVAQNAQPSQSQVMA